jgi:hypothetical protein
MINRKILIKPKEISSESTNHQNGMAIGKISASEKITGKTDHTMIYQNQRVNPRHSNYGIDFYRNRFKLDKSFLESINPSTKILEIGIGTGSIADDLLKHSKVDKHNYDLMELSFDELPEWKKKRILNYERYNKMHVTKGNIFHTSLPDEKYDHIFIVESFDPAMYFVKENVKDGIHEIKLEDNFQRIIENIAVNNKIDFNTAAAFVEGKAFLDLADRFESHLKKDGEIRQSPVSSHLLELIKEYPEKLKPKGFDIEVINVDRKGFASVILKKID